MKSGKSFGPSPEEDLSEHLQAKDYDLHFPSIERKVALNPKDQGPLFAPPIRRCPTCTKNAAIPSHQFTMDCPSELQRACYSGRKKEHKHKHFALVNVQMALGQTAGCPRVNRAKKFMCSPRNTGNINFSLWLTLAV